ncbi:hypothetical protein [Paenibacillus taiwanensis]|uniref:hypothetical protein n=1 Tax=Paenibacillus taiwanensis TaxID=401638 RepID=UPI00041BA3BB|nr:hypothetical protein [Paenibacillus taiwanensis]
MNKLNELNSQLQMAVMNGDEAAVEILRTQIESEKKSSIEHLRHELNAEYQRGALKDDGKIAALNEQIQSIEQAQRLEVASSEIAGAMDEMEIDGIPLRHMFLNEDNKSAEAAYQAVSIFIKMMMTEREKQRLKELAEYDRKLWIKQQENEQLKKSHDEVFSVNAELRREISIVRLELEETGNKRDAAAAEIERLKSQIDDLRNEKAVDAKEAVKVIDTNLNTNLSEYMKRWKDNRPAIINKRPLDNLRSRYGAELVETGEYIEFSFMGEGKYREVTAEEAERFRAEAEAKRQAEEAAKLVESSLPIPVIPSEGAVNGLDQTGSSVAMDGETETFEEEMRRRVSKLEQLAGIKGAA